MWRTGMGVGMWVAVGLLGLAGCGGGTQESSTTEPEQPPAVTVPETPPAGTTGETAAVREVEMVTRDFRFEPAEITATPGEKLRVRLQNSGQSPHNIEFELPSGEVELPQNVAPGSTGVLEFTAPTQPGRYVFYCPVGNHEDQGMKGVLVVQ